MYPQRKSLKSVYFHWKCMVLVNLVIIIIAITMIIITILIYSTRFKLSFWHPEKEPPWRWYDDAEVIALHLQWIMMMVMN